MEKNKNTTMKKKSNGVGGEGSSASASASAYHPPFTFPKAEMDYYDGFQFLSPMENVGCSSSASNLRAHFMGMGFTPSLVDKVIRETGEHDAEKLLEALLHSSDLQNSNSCSSDSLGSLFDDMNASDSLECSTVRQPKEELDVLNAVEGGTRESLLKMHFSAVEVDYAMSKLGANASIGEIVDFILTEQKAEGFNKKSDVLPHDKVGSNKDISNETLFGTMEKTLSLLEMGFSENEISSVIERFGSNLPVTELANAICADQLGECYYIKPEKVILSCSFTILEVSDSQKTVILKKESHYIKPEKALIFFRQSTQCCSNDVKNQLLGNLEVKPENLGQDSSSESRRTKLKETAEGKRPMQDNVDAELRHCGVEENLGGKRLKQEYTIDSSSYLDSSWVEEKIDLDIPTFGLPKMFNSAPCRSLDGVVAKPPYFFYGDVMTVSLDSWHKVSQFLYSLEPEFVDTRFFSALSRKEGYIHNLPAGSRFHILPKPPLTIQDALSNTKRWWPSWDTRIQLSCINCETSELSPLCHRLGRMVSESDCSLSPEQRRYILGKCSNFNLIWVGPQKLAHVEPEQLELILGYPLNHTLVAEISLTERLLTLRDAFQIDALGYHLSVLKSMFPAGITLLSIFSGIGGAEVALHRLGIHLKGVVSVESSETKRKIFKTWWLKSKQAGQLEQVEDIHKLTTTRIEKLMEKVGDFDLVICQNSYSRSLKDLKGPAFDFSSFYEFVRVLQRVRSIVDRKI